MKLVVLGSTGYHPNNRRQTACMMLPEIGVVLDAGTGMFRVRDFLQTQTLDIFLSHVHLDHVIGVTFLFDILHGKNVHRTTVHGEADKLQAVQEHLLNQHLFPVQLPCEYRALQGPVSLGGGGTLRHFPVTHPGGAVGFRIDWPDRSLAYVTDTTAAADARYVEEVRGVDLLLHECYYPDEERDMAQLTGHSHVTPVAELAKAADVGRLVLVHLWPLMDTPDPVGLQTAKKIFRKTTLAKDLMEIEF